MAAGGLAVSFISAAVIVYVLLDWAKPPKNRIVAAMRAARENWKRIYGWTYLDKPISGRPAPIPLRFSGMIADRLGIRSLFADKLTQAGLSITPDKFISWHLYAVLFIGILGYIAAGLILMVVLAFTVAVLPFLILPIIASRRRARLDEQLSDTLQLIGSLLRAGHGFPQALNAVAQETQPPMSLVLRDVLAQVELGGTIEEGLDKVASEIGSVSLGWAVTAVKIQREVGGNLSEILDILSFSIRERGELNRQVKALTAEGRLSAYILIVMPFALVGMLYQTNPSYVSLLWRTTTGLILLGSAASLMIIGSVWLWRIVRVEV